MIPSRTTLPLGYCGYIYSALPWTCTARLSLSRVHKLCSTMVRREIPSPRAHGVCLTHPSVGDAQVCEIKFMIASASAKIKVGMAECITKIALIQAGSCNMKLPTNVSAKYHGLSPMYPNKNYPSVNQGVVD